MGISRGDNIVKTSLDMQAVKKPLITKSRKVETTKKPLNRNVKMEMSNQMKK